MAKLTTLKSTLPRLATKLQPQRAERLTGRPLQRIRMAQFRNNPLCVRCQERGIVTLASQSDHIIALCNGGAESPDNRQLLCDDCHEEKTREDLRIARGET